MIIKDISHQNIKMKNGNAFKKDAVYLQDYTKQINTKYI